MAKEFTFEDLNKEMAKTSTLGERLDKSDISKIDDYIDSGNYHLNACIAGSLSKGYPNNRAVCLAGPSGCLVPDEKIKVYVMKTKTNSNREKIETT